MIKWPWKANQAQAETFADWQEALSIPLLSPLDEQEQRRLVAVASQILQNKRIVPLQGLELTSLMQARIALLFALPVMELGAECLDGFNEVLLYPTPSWWKMNGRMILVWCIPGRWYKRAKAGSRDLSCSTG